VDECKPLPDGVPRPSGDQAVGELHQLEPGREQPQGRAVQVDPVKSRLKPPGTKRLKLKYEGPLSNFGFKFILRRYSKCAIAYSILNFQQQPEGMSKSSYIWVGQCR